MSDLISKFIDLLLVRGGGPEPIDYRNYGYIIKPYDGAGPVGGNLNQITTDQYGRLVVSNLVVSSVLGCGHLVTSTDQIAGVCRMCGTVCCILPGCLAICELKGITVCRKHYSIKHGVVVSKIAQKGLWGLKAKKIRNNKVRQIELEYKNRL